MKKDRQYNYQKTKIQKDKQRSTKQYIENYRSSNTSPNENRVVKSGAPER